MTKVESEGKAKTTPSNDKRIQVSQSDVPAMSLDQAIRVPRAIAEHYAGGTVTPLQLAAGLNMTPTSGPFRMLCGASIAFGLTEGGYNAKEISLTPLGKQLVKPLDEGDDLRAKREATLRPRVLGEFLRKYDGSSLPRTDIARNVLEEMKVPSERSEAVYQLIVESAKSVGFVRAIKDKQYVDLDGTTAPIFVQETETETQHPTEQIPPSPSFVPPPIVISATANRNASEHNEAENRRRVFVTHGRNRDLIEPIKKLLEFGEMVPVISVQRESVSKPVPDKVMDDMRSCGAAIIHVADEARLMDDTGKVRVVINENVLIEIGAAMALYKGRFILLVKNGLELPSNLQGLYQVRYEGETLDVHATIRLMEAIKELKTFGSVLREPEALEGVE
jgi:hypothetical protein